MSKALELAGRTFGRLKVLERAKPDGASCVSWICQCACGRIVPVRGPNLASGNTTSCGCSHVKHGHSGGEGKKKSAEYTVWHKMLDVCHCPTNDQFHNYGDKGIGVCERWRNSFVNFLEDMGEKPPHHTLARKDKKAGFSPDNCFWRTRWFRPFESLYNRAKREASTRGWKFDLTYGEFLEFTLATACHYCGFDVCWKDHGRAHYNLDRKDNTKDYSRDNCVVCCFDCNATKGARFSYEEMLILGKAIREIRLARLRT